MSQATKHADFKIVKQDKVFRFRNLCPYCGANLTARADSWEQQTEGFWMPDNFDIECETMPDFSSKDWDEWMNNHSQSPYEYWHPIASRIKKYIQNKYRMIV